ncbi:uncharacterized protein K452DRAFT_114250 [Aplosporella prunicola CBS 121167]|uniref:Uncharacterized protein n=1 Tax=Aplosporella prunicola CBS 121167 TaxID=1176127 RepID=A0A6A6AYU4_9PEZI|nr:uncharacterized protein K452DRAFT_114250 [Aplosporella prunicola CBS 121167]KAF2137102.1 hypothetical protein K452DRAFT_114250 [Aplosporella prunicola CBS 121167]
MDPRSPKAGPGQQILSRAWINRNMLTSSLPGNPFGNVRAANRLVDHLGGLAHLDRVVILVDRVNSVKGQLFRGVSISNEGDFGDMRTSEEQLLYVKEVGGVFTYMALDPVWRAFCGTYNGIYNDLHTFSNWYNGQPGNAQIALHTDWANFVRITLDSVVLNGRSKLQAFYAQRRIESLYMEARWFLAFSGNRLLGNWQNIKLDRTDVCTNLPPSRAGPPVWGGT